MWYAVIRVYILQDPDASNNFMTLEAFSTRHEAAQYASELDLGPDWLVLVEQVGTEEVLDV